MLSGIESVEGSQPFGEVQAQWLDVEHRLPKLLEVQPKVIPRGCLGRTGSEKPEELLEAHAAESGAFSEVYEEARFGRDGELRVRIPA
jgi:hypothetical protein